MSWYFTIYKLSRNIILTCWYYCLPYLDSIIKQLRVLIQRMYLFYVSTFCYLFINITLTFTQSIVLDFRLFTCVNNLATSEDTTIAVVVPVLIETTIAVDKWHSFDKMQNCKSLVNCKKIIIACRCISLL